MRCKLSDVCTIRYGKDHKRLSDGNIPVYGSGGIMRYVDTALYDKKSVLIPRKGTLDNLFFVKEPFWTVDTLFYTEIDEAKIVPEYLYYQLRMLDLASMNVGTAVPSLTTAVLNEIELELPSLNEQKAIAGILCALDDKIAVNTEINQQLEQIAQAIFKSWFVDFEPFGGEMPRDWQEGTLGDISNISSGKRPVYRQTDYSDEVNIPILGASSIMGYTNAALYNEKVLVTGRVGTHGVIQRYSRPCWPSDNTLVLKSQFFEFTYQQLLIIDFRSMNRGSTQPLITQTDLKNVPILIPNETTLLEFEELAGSLMAQQEANILENEYLATIRDTLLPRLMSGELTVADLKDIT